MDSDFIIIGGGIAGVSAGARLAPFGRVTILEAEDAIGYHTSGRSAAMYEARYGHATTITLNLASREVHDTIDGGVLSPRGLMLLAGHEEEDLFTKDCADMHMQEISIAEAQARVPILNPAYIERVAIEEDAFDIDTDRLMQAFAKDIRAHGSIVTGACVTGIERDGARWRVRAAGETYTAPVLLNAAGSWGDHVAQLAGIAPLGLTPLRRSVARIPPPGGHDTRPWPMIMGAGERWYAKPDAGALLVSPAEEDPVDAPHDAWADDLVLAEGIARYQPYVTEEVTRILSNWAGLRTFTPDRCLALGPDPDMPSFIWVVGQGGYGMQTSPAAGQLVADLITGRPPALDAATVDALSPKRFR